MHSHLHWLALTAFMTALFWMPYVLDRMRVKGVIGAMANPGRDDPPLADWAQRAARAHGNAAENLVTFAALILVADAMELNDPVLLTAAQIYFFTRLAHFVVYVLGLPGVRTLAFLVGFAAHIMVAGAIFGWF